MEREKEKVEGVVMRDTIMMEGQGSNIFGFEGSQTVPASPSGRSEACVQD
jgi:hypothetical protein